MSRRLTILCLLVLTVLFPGSALAQDSTESENDSDEAARLIVQPAGSNRGFFDLVLEPGDDVDLAIELANNGDRTGTGLVYAADAYTQVNGGFGSRMQDDSVTGTTQWISLEREQILLEPGIGVQRSLSLRVPEGTPPGEYISAIVFENTETLPIGSGQGVQLNQRSRDVIALFIEVPGPKEPEFSIGEVSQKSGTRSTAVVFELDNAGNERLRLSGSFRLEDTLENVLLERDVEMQIFYAGHQTRLEVGLGDILPPGDYVVWLTLEDPNRGASASVEGVALVVPEPETDEPDGGITGLLQPPRIPGDGGDGSWWTLLAIVAGVSLLAALAGILIGRRRRTQGPAVVDSDLTQPEPEPESAAPVIQPRTSSRRIRSLSPPRRAD